jgi:hypothetical protein
MYSVLVQPPIDCATKRTSGELQVLDQGGRSPANSFGSGMPISLPGGKP